eukprot:TRINITY_DN1659_c0_g1_i5.p2 TRINITY_DN1659_c0_g1~~TRINITY_DN1659_c0_g1_i5.p2  ORF type:complete len:256 (+),score=16.79 TRINITY_DN1659_c0_g1_i5:117-770(+)
MQLLEKVGLKRNGNNGYEMDHTPTPLKKSKPTRVPDAWSRSADLDCAKNALYMYLALCDYKATLDEVRSTLAVGEKGASMLDIKAAAQHFGAELQVVNGSVDSLTSRLPAIVRMAPKEASGDIGHFVVLVKSDKDMVTFLDGSDGVASTASLNAFSSDYSGYAVLHPYSHYKFASLYLLDYCIVLALALEAAGFIWLTIAKSRRQKLAIKSPQQPLR